MVIGRTDNRLAVVQRNPHNLGVALSHTRVNDTLDPNRAIPAESVAEVLFARSLFGHELLEAQGAPVGKSDPRISRKTTTCGISFHHVKLTPCRVGVRAVGQL